MGIKSHSAYAGEHKAAGIDFLIFYADKARVGPWNDGLPRGHHLRFRAGWYWLVDGESDTGGRPHGAFTSSRMAHIAATQVLAS